MQRRLTIVLVATALVSIVLVGFGVLAMAQLSARANAQDQVTRNLNVVADLVGPDRRTGPNLERLLLGSRRNFELTSLQAVVLTGDGEVAELQTTGRRGPPTGGTGDVAIERLPVLDGGDLDRLRSGEVVLLDVGRSVVGIRLLAEADGPDERMLAVVAEQTVTAVTRQTVAWFAMSSIAVLIGALLAGLLLARRLTGPLADIEATTSAIASGQLQARVEVDGTDEVAQLGSAVNRMAADLERSKALDRQFLMSVSHDLRTPLTAIAGYAEALRDGAATDTRGAGEVIGNHADRLDHLVGDLLDLARLDANRFRLETTSFDLVVVAGRTVAGMANRAAQDGVELVVSRSSAPSPVMVVADPERTTQAITNIIDNGRRFARSRIEVAVTVDPGSGHGTNSTGNGSGQGPGWATVDVIDDGPGFAAEDLPHIFDRLYIGKSGSQPAESSTGLGLAIVRELAAAMGGSVSATNGPAGGAALSLTLPLAPITEGAQPPQRPPDLHRPTAPPTEPASRYPASGSPTRSFPNGATEPPR